MREALRPGNRAEGFFSFEFDLAGDSPGDDWAASGILHTFFGHGWKSEQKLSGAGLCAERHFGRSHTETAGIEWAVINLRRN